MTTMDEAPPPGKRPAIHRQQDTSTYTYPVPRACLMQMLRLARIAREAANEPYPLEAAIVSVMLDIDRKGAPGSKAGYRTLFGWSEQEIRTRWEEIIATAEQWRTAFGRLSEAPEMPTDDQRTTNGPATENPANSGENPAVATDDQRTSNGRPTTTKQLYNSTTPEENTPPTPQGGSATANPPETARERRKRERLERGEAIRIRLKAFRAARLEAQAEEVYRAYPRHTKKPGAIRAIERAIQADGFEFVLDQTQLFAEIRRRDIAAGDEPRFTPHPATWFNARQYNDDPTTWERTPKQGLTHGRTHQQQPSAARRDAEQRDNAGYANVAADVERELRRVEQLRGQGGGFGPQPAG